MMIFGLNFKSTGTENSSEIGKHEILHLNYCTILTVPHTVKVEILDKSLKSRIKKQANLL